jgi:hypothetical protein
MPEELAIITNPATAYSRRRKYWIEANGEVPAGYLVAATCGDKLCVDRAHLVLREKIVQNKWKWLRDAVKNLSDGDYFDVRDYPRDSRAIVKLKTVLALASDTCRIHFTYRQFPSGGVRIIRSGDFYDPDTETPSMFRNVTNSRRPAHFFLGFMRNYGEQFQRVAHCKIKACPMPLFRGVGEYCFQHNHFFDYKMSMTDSALDAREMYNPAEPHAPYTLAREFLISTDNLEKSLRFRDQHGNLVAAHRNAGTSNYSRSPTRLHMRLGNGSHTSSKTSRGRRRRASRDHGHRDLGKKKRWSRETIEALELEADHILGLDSPEVIARAELMRREQMASA